MGKAASQYKRATIHALIDSLSKDGAPDAQEAFAFLFAVMRGEIRVRKRVREPGADEDIASAALIPFVEVEPTINERMSAARDIIAYRIGKPSQSIELDVSHSITKFRDLSKLNDIELVELEALLTRAPVLEASVEPAKIAPSITEGEIVE